MALVAHGLFMEGSEAAVTHPAIGRVITTDSVPPFRVKRGPMRNKVQVLSCAPPLAETIRRLHEDKPLSDLLVF
ncbi:MAG: hypothetical protein WAL20_14240 [Rhodomicrobium sp.]